MWYAFKAIKDTYIKEDTPYSGSNFGKDEILELGRIVASNTASRSRILIDFNTEQISESIANGTIPATASFELKLYECQHTGSIQDNYWIDAHGLTTSWNEGTGSISAQHLNGYANWFSASNNTAWSSAGADYSSSVSSSQFFSTGSGDILIDVTTIISGAVNSGFVNKGLLLKTRDDVSSGSFGIKKFYSKDTHTIYEPVLLAKWDDSIATGSLVGRSTYTPQIFSLVAPKEKYYFNEKPYFEVYIRDTYPTMSWGVSAADIVSTVLDNLYYSIEDSITHDVIIPFSSQSRLSYNAITNKNYFYSYMNCLTPNRSYDIKIKHIFSGSQEIQKIHTFWVEE